MRVRFILGGELDPRLRPTHQTLLGHLVDEANQLGGAFDQRRPIPLVAPILGGELTQAAALVSRDAVDARSALLAAGNDPPLVKLAPSATAVGFAAAALEQIEGALDHGLGALESVQKGEQSGVKPPESLAEFGELGAQSGCNIQ